MILKISRSQGVSIAYILKNLMAKIKSVHRLDNMKTIFKFVVDWENSFKHDAFTGIYNF